MMNSLMSNRQPQSRVLVVDDEPFIREFVARWLRDEGYDCESASNVEEAQATLNRNAFEVLLSDINMPGKSGIELLSWVRRRLPDIAVIMITGLDDRRTAVRLLEQGAYGYLVKPVEENELLINVANALERRRLTMESQEYERRLEDEVRERTADVRHREEELVLRLVSASEFRDNETGAHIRRIGLYSSVLARSLGWHETRIEEIGLAATMHDIGKIGVPDSVLRKPGKLTKDEFREMQRHCEIGAQIMDGSDVPLLRRAKEIALAHHEWWDGCGYPSALAGTDIPIAARIVAIADVYDALVHKRVYKPAIPENEALEMMEQENGRHFDPEIFDRFLSVIAEFRSIRESVAECAYALSTPRSV